MKKYLIAMVGMLFFSSSVFAAGYGKAGCGLGSVVLGDDPGVQLFAATTNGTSASQAFGISSGTSNCDASGIVLAERQDDLFVAGNFENLEKEMALGEGEHLEVLASLVGCPAEQKVSFASYTQEHYSAIFASTETTPEEMLQALKGGLSSHPELSSCRH